MGLLQCLLFVSGWRPGEQTEHCTCFITVWSPIFIRSIHPMGGNHMCPREVIPSPVVKGHDKRQDLVGLRTPLGKACLVWDVRSLMGQDVCGCRAALSICLQIWEWTIFYFKRCCLSLDRELSLLNRTDSSSYDDNIRKQTQRIILTNQSMLAHCHWVCFVYSVWAV